MDKNLNEKPYLKQRLAFFVHITEQKLYISIPFQLAESV